MMGYNVEIKLLDCSIENDSKRSCKLVGSAGGTWQVPDGDVIHDLPEHGRGDDGLTVARQQRVVTSVNDLSL